MEKLDWDFNLQWKKISDDFGLGEFIETGNALIALTICCNADGVSSLFHNLPRIFVIPERNELGVPAMSPQI
jgi:hypothetical protein